MAKEQFKSVSQTVREIKPKIIDSSPQMKRSELFIKVFVEKNL